MSYVKIMDTLVFLFKDSFGLATYMGNMFIQVDCIPYQTANTSN